jgi:hypothetical protein
MNRDSKAPVIARVDLSKVSLIDESKLGIDFFNEIDVWAKMAFRSREQSLGRKGSEQVLSPRPYSFREKIG